MKTINHPTGYSAVTLALIGTLLLIASGCNDSSNGPNDPGGNPPANGVTIQGMAFNPATITVKAGSSVTWTNKDGMIHNVTSNTGVFSSGSISDNGTFSQIFNSVGTYPYYCTIHPSMTATVIVTN
jgi:plastocyanin